jgi:mannose-1-phosphate guanylyltransferase
MPGIEHFWAVVPAGGAGTRLWPMSRSASPKFLHDLTGSGRSLLQDTVERLTPLTGDRLLVVTGARHRDRVVEQLPGLKHRRVLGEPSPRDSMAAIGLAAAVIERVDPDAVLGSFAADHVIRGRAVFESAVTLAAEVARDDWLVTVGIAPSEPSTAFGYLRQGAALQSHDGAFVVEQFVEKPSLEVARTYVESGDYRWNAGMFVVRPTVLLDLLAVGHPELAAALRALAADLGRLEELWPTLTRIAIDHAVAEPAAAAGRVACIPADLGWDDVGDWASLAGLLPEPAAGAPRVLGRAQDVLALDSSGLVVAAGGRRVVLVGLHDVVVVDTPDAVLVMPAGQAQRVKDVVAQLRAAGRSDLL